MRGWFTHAHESSSTLLSDHAGWQVVIRLMVKVGTPDNLHNDDTARRFAHLDEHSNKKKTRKSVCTLFFFSTTPPWLAIHERINYARLVVSRHQPRWCPSPITETTVCNDEAAVVSWWGLMIDTPGNPAQIERSSINDFNDTQSMTLRMLMILCCFFFLWTTFAHLVNISSLYYHLGRWVT